MKQLFIFFLIIIIAGCGSSGGGGSDIKELKVSDNSEISSNRLKGSISTNGEVDRYRVRLAETGRILQLRVTSQTLEPDVDLLLNVYEQDASGNVTMIAGAHAPENSKFGADIKVNIYVDRPKDLYVNVRDLQDNDSSDNPYHIAAYYEAPPDGNGSFASAVNVGVGANPVSESIGTVGDVDCFGFTIANAGVYDVLVEFDPMPGTGVRLSLDLFDEAGTLIESRNPGSNNTSHMVHYFTPGNYRLVVDDEGKDDFDSSSQFNVSVSAKPDVTEVLVNDTPATASTAESLGSGAIDYFEDKDWHKIEISESSDINIMELRFQSAFVMDYMLEVYKIHDNDLSSFDFEKSLASFSHLFRGGSENPYIAVLKMDTPEEGENYYFVARPQSGSDVAGSTTYTASITMENISDPDEAGDGNDLDSNAIDITSVPGQGADYSGKIAYRGDIDWYKVRIPLSSSNRVLSFYLDIPQTEQVQYGMTITRETRSGEDSSYGIDKRVVNGSLEHRTVDLKTGFLVKGQSGGLSGYSDAVYLIKVYDFQNDSGDNSEYKLRWNLNSIPGSISASGPVSTPTYNNETSELSTSNAGYEANNVAIDYTDGKSGSFKVNSSALNFASATSSTGDDGVVTLTLPWVGGYIDYQDDEDWYSLDLSNPFVEADMWYYTIEVETYAANSEQEYIWEYFPDSNNDFSVHANRCSGTARHCSGIMASGGDTDVSVGVHSSTFPSSGSDVLWLGSLDGTYSWKGKVFFRISDFNFLNLTSNTINTNPDNDFGFDAPYFFRVKLKFYQGGERP